MKIFEYTQSKTIFFPQNHYSLLRTLDVNEKLNFMLAKRLFLTWNFFLKKIFGTSLISSAIAQYLRK